MTSDQHKTAAFWVSWWLKEADGAFELHSPWWISGERMDGAQSVCAAIRAESEAAAQGMVLASYDRRPADLEWRFCEARPVEWSPFSSRFRRADWMKWEAT